MQMFVSSCRRIAIFPSSRASRHVPIQNLSAGTRIPPDRSTAARRIPVWDFPAAKNPSAQPPRNPHSSFIPPQSQGRPPSSSRSTADKKALRVILVSAFSPIVAIAGDEVLLDEYCYRRLEIWRYREYRKLSPHDDDKCDPVHIEDLIAKGKLSPPGLVATALLPPGEVARRRREHVKLRKWMLMSRPYGIATADRRFLEDYVYWERWLTGLILWVRGIE